MLKILALVLVFFAAASSPSAGATLTMQGDTIHLRGQIVAADPLRLAKLIDGASAIVLDSRGGLVGAGVYMAHMIRDARLTTIVRGECASACTIMFYAGTRRQLSGRLGFHRATDAAGTKTYVASMRRYGAPAEAVNAILDTPPSSITWLR
jgi:hypothetical protein